MCRPEPTAHRRRRGARSERWGRAAEDIAARAYEARGARILARRRRTEGGEIDLIAREGGAIVFIEVKARATTSEACASMSPARWRRFAQAAEACAAQAGWTGDMRLDLAAVDRQGGVSLLENAGMEALAF